MRTRGFTVVELCVVLCILGVLFILGSSWLGKTVSTYKFNNAVAILKNSVNVARLRAMGRAGGVGSTIFIQEMKVNGSFLDLTVGQDPYHHSDDRHSDDPPMHQLELEKLYYVELVGFNPNNFLDDFPWLLNNRIYEAEAPDKTTIKCKLAEESKLELDPNPMALAPSALVRVVTVVRLVGMNSGQEVDSVSKDIMRSGEYAKIKDKGSVIEFIYNKNRLKALFLEVNDEGKQKPIDTKNKPLDIVFDQTGFTKNSTAYNISFEQEKAKNRSVFKIMPSGVIR